MKQPIIIVIIILSFIMASSAQVGRIPLSPTQTISQTVGLTEVTVVYSRPAKRDRKLFGALVPYNTMWRTGANRNTKLTISEDVMIGDHVVKSGTYAIFTKPSAGQWEFFIYADTDNWDVPEDFDLEKVVAQIKSPVQKLNDSYESFTITLDNTVNNEFDLRFYWDDVSVKLPIHLKTADQMHKKIEKVLSGPHPADYYLAAQYYMEANENHEQALSYINKTLELRDVPKPWDYRIKASILMQMKEYSAAEETIKMGMSSFTDKMNEGSKTYYRNQFESMKANIKLAKN